MSKEASIRKRALEILNNGKWLSWYAPKVKFQQTDIFGVFDLICWEKAGKRLKFIQLTTLPNLSARRKKIQGFFKKNKIKAGNIKVEIWAWSNKKKIFKKEMVNIKIKEASRKTKKAS